MSGRIHLIRLALQPRHISFEYFSLRRFVDVSAIMALEVWEGGRCAGQRSSRGRNDTLYQLQQAPRAHRLAFGRTLRASDRLDGPNAVRPISEAGWDAFETLLQSDGGLACTGLSLCFLCLVGAPAC